MGSFTHDHIFLGGCATISEVVDGYPKLAEHMGGTPEISIFRRFQALNRQNLFYLQAELTRLPGQLRIIEAESATCNPTNPRSRYSRDCTRIHITEENSEATNGRPLFRCQ